MPSDFLFVFGGFVYFVFHFVHQRGFRQHLMKYVILNVFCDALFPHVVCPQGLQSRPEFKQMILVQWIRFYLPILKVSASVYPVWSTRSLEKVLAVLSVCTP